MAPFFIPNAKLAPDLMEFFGGFQQVVSYLFDPDRIFENNLRRCGVKNLIVVSPKIDDSQHASCQLARPLEALALYLENPGAKLHPASADRAFAVCFFEQVEPPIFAIHPGSGGERKNWPLERWIALCAWLGSLRPASTLLLIGGEADEERLAALERAMPRGLRFKVARHLPLFHLAALVERCSLFLGHDSGISHLAAAVQARCVLLFGPTDPEVWAPANPAVSVLRAPGGAMERLDLETVQQAVSALLGNEA